MKGEEIDRADVAASFQKAVVDVIVDHSISATKETGSKKLVMAGGVAANSALRKAMEEACDANDIKLFVPPLSLCTDNAAMIGSAAYYAYLGGDIADLDLNAVPQLKIGEKLF